MPMQLDPVVFGPALAGGVRCTACELPVTLYDGTWLHVWPGDASHEPRLPRQKIRTRYS